MNNPMTNSPVAQMMNLARTGGNPMAFLQQLAGRNPQAAQVMRMMRGKNSQQLRTMAENMAKERGTSLEQVVSQLGIPLPR